MLLRGALENKPTPDPIPNLKVRAVQPTLNSRGSPASRQEHSNLSPDPVGNISPRRNPDPPPNPNRIRTVRVEMHRLAKTNRDLEESITTPPDPVEAQTSQINTGGGEIHFVPNFQLVHLDDSISDRQSPGTRARVTQTNIFLEETYRVLKGIEDSKFKVVMEH